MPQIYGSPHARTIADLMRQQGEVRARQAEAQGQAEAARAAASGQIWGRAIQNIGQEVSGTLADFAKQRQGPTPDDVYKLAQVQKIRAELAKGKEEDKRAKIGEMASMIAASGYKPEAAEPLFRVIASESPEYEQPLMRSLMDPQSLKQVTDQLRTLAPGYKAPEGFALSEGQTRFDASGKPVASVPKPEPVPQPFTLTPGAKRYGPSGEVIAEVPAAETRPQLPTRASLAASAAAGDAQAAKALRLMEQTTQTPTMPESPPIDANPDTQSILGQTGLTYNGFLALTGRMSQLPRDRATRAEAAREVQQWANKHGVDVSTFASQYKALNDVVEKNIERFNNTRIAEGELAGTLDNLSAAATESGLDEVRAYNAVKLWMKGEVNNPDVQKYAFHLNQLRSELAFYNAATQGRAGNVLQHDMAEAERILKQGVAAGSLSGMKSALERSVEKMGGTLSQSIDRANQDVWKLFGVGDKYKSKTTPAPSTTKPPVKVGGFTIREKG